MATSAPTRVASRTSARFVSPQLIRFMLVGLSGIVVNQLIFSSFVDLAGVAYPLAAFVATQGSSTWNFFWSERWVFDTAGSPRSAMSRFGAFMVMNNITLVARIPALWVLVDIFHAPAFWANLATLGGLFASRFFVARNMIWATSSPADAAIDAAAALPLGDDGSTPLPSRFSGPNLRSVGPGRAKGYSYDIAGIFVVESAVQLRELGFFRTDDAREPDLRIVINRTGSMPIRRTRFTADGDRLLYREQLGAAGANFRIEMGTPITVSVNRLLAQSPHVLYTNVVEALLRFLLVSKGYVLLHSASLAANGRATLLSAQTDTGKTSTVIRLVRERGYTFLSDDMTIITADGRALSYPKPMTLSYHTMSAIAGKDLKGRQRAALAIQSRLHSKSGRSVGRYLGGLNLPIMSVNSIVQMIIPPPKYHINSLFDCEVGGEAPIEHVFVLERGEACQEEISLEAAVDQLIENTDDAYGFPPFASFAPHLRIDGDDYPTLRHKERAILTSALARTKTWRLRVSGHEWADLLPDIIEGQPGRSRLIAIPIDPIADAVSEAPSDVAAEEVG
jgi:dolichol-phosphate mannosyltransferase